MTKKKNNKQQVKLIMFQKSQFNFCFILLQAKASDDQTFKNQMK